MSRMRLRNVSVRSARAIVSTQKWWFIQMIPIVRELVAYARYVGQSVKKMAPRASHVRWRSPETRVRERRCDGEDAVAERLEPPGSRALHYATAGASSRPMRRTDSRSRWLRCWSMTRSQPARSYSRSCAATSSTEAENRAAFERLEPLLERHGALPDRVERLRALNFLVGRLTDKAARHDGEAKRPRFLPDLRRLGGRRTACCTRRRSGAPARAVPRFPPPPTMIGGRGFCTGFGQPGRIFERVVVTAEIDALLQSRADGRSQAARRTSRRGSTSRGSRSRTHGVRVPSSLRRVRARHGRPRRDLRSRRRSRGGRARGRWRGRRACQTAASSSARRAPR